MLSIELIRNEPDRVRASLARRGYDAPIDRVLEIDACRRNVLSQADQLRAHRNEVSRQIGQSKDRPAELIIQMANVGDKIKELEVATRRAEDELNILLLDMPNLPADDVPDGLDDDANVVEHTVGVLPSFNFEPQPHWEIGERLELSIFRRGPNSLGLVFLF